MVFAVRSSPCSTFRLCRRWPRPCSRRVPAGLAVFVSICWFLSRPPSSHSITAILAQTPIPPQGTSRGRYVIYLASVPRGCGYATQPNAMCHRTSNLKTISTCYGTIVTVFICRLAICVHDVWHRIFSCHVPGIYQVYKYVHLSLIHI